MAIIVPTITTNDPALLDASLTRFATFAGKRIQIDFSDGSLANTSTIPLGRIVAPAGVALDLHIIAAEPSRYLSEIVALKPALCILHAEASDNVTVLFDELKKAGIKPGIALLKGTFPGHAQDLISAAEYALIFAGDLGRQGGQADLLQIEKIPLVRAIKPELEIGWDGGVNLENARALAHAGADVLNVGSAITNAQDPPAAYEALVAEVEKKGIAI